MAKKDFNEFRFEGLNPTKKSNQYLTMNRVSDNENKIVVKVGGAHLIKTKYGYALILDNTHVVFLKEWAVDCNWFGNEVLLDREYFTVKEWGNHEDFETNEEALNFDFWVELAKEQDSRFDEDGFKINKVNWTL